MSTSDPNPTQRRLVHEWYGALATVIGGFVIAIAVVAYFSFATKPATQTGKAAQPAQTISDTQKAQLTALVQAGAEICGVDLANAQNFGVVPGYAKLTTLMPRKTDVRGRYVCIAATSVAQYLMASDLLCTNFKDPRCVSLFSVTQTDGTVLYQRQS